LENLRGAIFMVMAMFCFAIEDMLIKTLAVDLPVAQILAIICAGAFGAFVAWSVLRGIPLWQREFLRVKVLLRSTCEVIGTFFFVVALSLIPLTTASAVIQATPLVVAMGAGLFLGQTIGWRRWVAILVGFIGVLLIIRPGLNGFNPATLLAVGGMLGLAARDLLTRGLNVQLSGVQLATHAYGFIVLAVPLLALILNQPFVMPTPQHWLLLAGATLVGLVAYLLLIAATRDGNAGIISSFRYSRMVFALVIGYAAFGEWPDLATFIGAAIIIGSGIFTLWREARLRRASLAATATL
jgi:drug/metabolite transporter (DMT)-like permease